MRAVGLDFGNRRIGVAVSDSAGTLAVPRGVIARNDDDDSYRALIAAVVSETGAEALVVGLPLSLDGSRGPAARWAEDEARELAAVLEVPVYLHDERLSSVEAARRARAARQSGEDRARAARQSGEDRARAARHSGKDRAQGGRGRRPALDPGAAAIMLQSWLDTRRQEVG